MSYITKSVQQKLSLTTNGRRSTSIMTFGTIQGDDQSCEHVSVGLKSSRGQELILQLLSVPNICKPLTFCPLVDCRETYPHLTGLELADASVDNHSLQVDVLIGSDHY